MRIELHLQRQCQSNSYALAYTTADIAARYQLAEAAVRNADAKEKVYYPTSHAVQEVVRTMKVAALWFSVIDQYPFIGAVCLVLRRTQSSCRLCSGTTWCAPQRTCSCRRRTILSW